MGWIPLRAVLTLLVVVTVVPLGSLTAALMMSSWRSQREGVDRQNIEFARAVSVALDQQVENTIASLDVLASTNSLTAGDIEAFRPVAQRVVSRHPQWHAVLVAHRSGRLVLDTAAAAAPLGEAEWARAVFETRRPAVSDLLHEPGIDGAAFIVAVPASRSDDQDYVVAARLRSAGLSAVLRQQVVPPDGVVTLIDGTRRIMARTRSEAEFVGRAPSPGFAAAAERMSEGSWREVLLEGTPAYAALSRSLLTGWTVGIGLPAEQVDGPIRRLAWLFAIAWTAITGMAAGLALAIGRMLARSLDSAGAAAHALATGSPVTVEGSRIREVHQLSASLSLAGATRDERLRERNEAERARGQALADRETALAAERAARLQAERASRLKEEFLMTVSHELRTPLTAIAGWSRMLALGDIRDSQRQHAIETIERNARALTLIVTDLLDASSAATGKLRLNVRRLHPAAVVQSAVDSMKPAASARGIRIHLDVTPLTAEVMADEDRLHQVVWNLLSNAFKFSPDGATVRVSIEKRDSRVAVTVRDEGPGVDPAFLPFVFDRFRQGPRRPGEVSSGVGLGLTIVRHLVELHGGAVEAKNNANGPGASFRVWLPLAETVEPEVGVPSSGAPV